MNQKRTEYILQRKQENCWSDPKFLLDTTGGKSSQLCILAYQRRRKPQRLNVEGMGFVIYDLLGFSAHSCSVKVILWILLVALLACLYSMNNSNAHSTDIKKKELNHNDPFAKTFTFQLT